MTQGTTHGKRGDGYSLVELLVSMVVGVMVLGGIYQLIMQNQRVYKSQAQLAETQMQIRSALDVMARDIRQVGNDPTRTRFDQSNSPMPIRDPDKIQVLMDLPRDCGGAPGDTGSGSDRCPSTSTGCGATCLDGDTWDILDKNGDGVVAIGNVAERGENEFGNGWVGDINPDEDVTYEWVAATGRITRTVNFVTNQGVPTPIEETLVDYVEQTGPTFDYQYRPNNTEPYAVIVTLRGRTRDPDPQSNQYKYFALSSEILLRNMQGGGL